MIRKRYYWVLDINCDCAAYTWARSPVRNNTFPKCLYCRKSLGPMSIRVRWTGMALSWIDAVEKAELAWKKSNEKS